jgi:hypothetical protein
VTIPELRAGKRWHQLVPALDAVGTVDALLEAADVLKTRLANLGEAIRRWERVLTLDAHNAAARDALEDAYRARRCWSQLADLYEYRVATAELDGQLRVYLTKLVEVYRTELGDRVRAEDAARRLAALP